MPANTRAGRVHPTAGDEGPSVLERAGRTLAEERRRTADEREAFADLRRRVRDIRPASTPSARGAAGGALGGVATESLADRSPRNGLAAVRTAYRETVMSVPHFEAEYDESYAESVVEEFGPELARALVAGDRFNAACKRTLLEGIEECRSRRVTLEEALEAERESLDAARERVESCRAELASVTVDEGPPVVERVCPRLDADPDGAAALATDASFDALADARAELCTLDERCDAIAADRQAAIHRTARRLSLSVETADVPSFCYGDLPVVYPVLSVVTDLSERVRTCRRPVERAMASAP